MDSSQLQIWLSSSGIKWVNFYRTVDSCSGEVLLLILNHNGHELARKVFRPQETDWDNMATPKMWFYPPPDEAEPIDVDPACEFTFFITMNDYESPSGLGTNRAGRGIP